MTVNTKISTLVSSQLPAFVRDDHPLFTAFMEAYYEYLEQNVSDTGSTGTGKVIERAKRLMEGRDVEKSMDDFTNQLYSQFLTFLPDREIDNSNTSSGTIVGTNYLKYSDGPFITSSGRGWQNTNVTVESNVVAWIDGTTSGDRILETGTTSPHYIEKSGVVRPALGPLTLSLSWKPLGRQGILIQLKDTILGLDGAGLFINISPSGVLSTSQHNLGSGTVIANTVTTLANDWYRISLTGNTTAANANLFLTTFLTTSLSYPGVTYTGNTQLGAAFKDYQLEPGLVATEYTPTGNLATDNLTGITIPEYTLRYIKTLASDYKKLLPKIKDFYRARGTEKSYKFLMRLLTDGGESEILYPKDHILKASDGKWIIQKSLRVAATKLNGNSDNTLATFALYEGRQLQGLSSNTTASVERVEQFYELGTLINEIYLSSISNTFMSGEVVRAQYYDTSNNLVTVTSNIFSGLVSSVVVGTGGSGYAIGNPITFTGGGGTGAVAAVSSVSTGNVAGMQVVRGGSGYQQNNFLLFSGGGGSGANGNILTVNNSGTFHPNTYNIDANQISQIQSATWGSAQTIFARTTANLALNTISSLASTFTYSNCGPATIVQVLAPGTGYTSVPTISVIANTTVSALGILGSLIINSGGANYAAGDELVFTNPSDGYGFGAKANVMSVNGTGAITRVRYYTTSDNEIAGGLGYFDGYLPAITITSGAGVGANITAASQIASGASITPTTGTIGTILGVTIASGGQGYTTAPVATLPGYGDGTANLTTSVVQGIYTYPGYFLNQDGFPSSYNYIQDRDYWQNYSYVVRVGLAYEKWITAVKNLLHPSGIRVWGDYALVDDVITNTSNIATGNFGTSTANTQYYSANATYFDGGSYMKDMGGGYWFGVESGSMYLSQWFKFDNYLPNTTSEMTLFENTLSNGSFARIKAGIAKAPYIIGQNFVPYSEQMNNSPTWVQTRMGWTMNTGSTITSNGISNVTVVLSKAIPDSTSGQHYIRRYFNYGEAIPTGNNLTFSVFAQAAEYHRFYLRMLDDPITGSGGAAYFNVHPDAISSGAMVALVSPAGPISASNMTANAVHMGNGVVRCSTSCIMYANTKDVICDFIFNTNTVSETFTGDSVGGMNLGGGQIEPGYIHAGQRLANATFYSKTVATAPTATLGNANDDPSGTGHYVFLRFANGSNFGSLHIRTDHIAHPLQANIWYHMTWGGNVQHPQTGNIFLNNTRSTVLVSRDANTSGKISFATGNVMTFGANSAGGNTLKGYISTHWSAWFSGIWDPINLSSRTWWLAAPYHLTPNAGIDGPTSNGFGWAFPSIPGFYMRSNSASGNTNSGSAARTFSVTGNTIGLLPGPGHPSTFD